MQTALHIMALVEELRRAVLGREIVSTEFYKKERAAYLFVKGSKSRLAFGFIYHPHGAGAFLVPASKVSLTTREKPWPIFGLKGATITGVEQSGLDRIFEIMLEHETGKGYLVCEALGQNGNLWYLDADRRIVGTLRKRAFEAGEAYRPPPPPQGLSPLQVTDEALAAMVDSDSRLPVPQILSRRILGFNRTLGVEALHRAAIDAGSSARDTATRLRESIETIVAHFQNPEGGYLYDAETAVEAYPLKLASRTERPEKLKTLSLAVMRMSVLCRSGIRETDERKARLTAVKRGIRRLERRMAKVEKDIEEASGFDCYRRLGELLQINFDKISKGMTAIEVDDVVTAAERPVTIALDPSLSPSENVARYFRRHRKGKEGLGLLKRRLEITRQELGTLADIHSALEADYDAACRQYEAELATLLPAEPVSEETVPRLPFRRYALSTGLTIFVGRDGSDNDRTTFEWAKPYELWFHTQQCPGSHVVVKFPNKSFEPSRDEITEAAAIAAWFSKARHDSLVPVIYTERRYVRKPRKAKPGLVTVTREKSIMVAPRKPDR